MNNTNVIECLCWALVWISVIDIRLNVWACVSFGFLKAGPHLSLGGWLMIHIFYLAPAFLHDVASPTSHFWTFKPYFLVRWGWDTLNGSLQHCGFGRFSMYTWTLCLHKLSDLLWGLLVFLKTAVNTVKPSAYVGLSWTKRGNDAYFSTKL